VDEPYDPFPDGQCACGGCTGMGPCEYEPLRDDSGDEDEDEDVYKDECWEDSDETGCMCGGGCRDVLDMPHIETVTVVGELL
jgi:hypothetical protein